MRTFTFCFVIILIISTPSFSQANHHRNLLTGPYDLKTLEDIYGQGNAWNPFPAYPDRKAWNDLPETVKKAALRSADEAVNYSWPTLPATLYLEFARNGNRSDYEAIYFERRQKLEDLVTGELIAGQGKYIDPIINGIWSICEESSWCLPAHIGLQKNGYTILPMYDDNVVDLFAAETGSALAWTYYFLKDRLDKETPVVAQRIEYEINKRILTPVLERTDFWWMGRTSEAVNNWDPWIVSNWITCDLVMEKDPSRKAASLEKALACLDVFLNQYPDDGGCDEGPGYWSVAGGSLFDCLEWLNSSSSGRIDIYKNTLVYHIGNYICKAWIAGDYFINFADASAKEEPDPEILYRFGKRTDNKLMMGFGAYRLQRAGYSNDSYEMGRRLNEMFSFREISAYPAHEPLIADFWLSGTQVFGARSSAETIKGLYLAGKGGNNAESHNHNDVGNFIVYADGKPVIIDVGVETYRRETFNDQRYTIWTMQSQFHNLPTINGVMQKDGAEFRARDVSFTADSKSAKFSLDIAGAYPSEAGVNYWKRNVIFERGKSIAVTEDYSLKSVHDTTYISLMTPCNVNVAGNKILLTGRNPEDSLSATITYDPKRIKIIPEKIGITDLRLKGVWGDELTRIKMLLISPGMKGMVRYTITL